MILYHHATSVLPPPWLRGAPNLLHREDPGQGFTYGLGEPYEFGRVPDDAPEIGDGWRVALVGEFDPRRLYRPFPGQPVVAARDMQGRVWAAPLILGPDGSRAFQVKYGKGYLPHLSPEQEELVEFAKLARAELGRLLNDPNARTELMPTACGWASRALAYVNHITPEAIEALALLDEALVIAVLVTLASFTADADHG